VPAQTAQTLAAAVATGTRSATETTRDALARIESAAALNAFITVDADRALARAADLDRRRAAGETLGPLAGVPLAVKDNIAVRGMRTTAGSRILDAYVPPFDATAIVRPEAAGAVIVGKTNCDEFAMGSSNENTAVGVVRNPWAPDRGPGGSSGGSAAAVAAGCVPLALGSETGGSIRQPAAFCGVVGIKPTYGRISRYGLLAFASSLDQIGPLATTVADAALALAAMAGADECDATSAREPVFDPSALGDTLDGLRVGIPRDMLREGVDADVATAFEGALEALRALGATLVDVSLPHARYAIPAYYLIATAEASSNLARYDGVKYGFRAATTATEGLGAMYSRTRDQGFGAEVKRRIMLGTYVLSAGYYDAYYLKAQQVRTLLARDFDEAFVAVDVIAQPTSPVPPFKLGERTDDPLQMYLADVFTVSANLAGLPALSVPCGFADAAGARLPIGLQLTGRMFDEATLVRAGHAFERATAWHNAHPPAPDTASVYSAAAGEGGSGTA
jgi:aspartyl-tRNA(Asn)/glutamyl-tRNA(Gln) amidotransferase subunit A